MQVSDEHRALWVICFFTAARPESEACRLLQGDVVLPSRRVVRAKDKKPALGQVTFRNTKTGVDRTILLHPEAAKALRRVMQREPKTARARAA